MSEDSSAGPDRIFPVRVSGQWAFRTLPDGSVWLLAERARIQLREPIYVQAVQAAAGLLDWGDLREQFPQAALDDAVRQLCRRGILTSGEPTPSRGDLRRKTITVFAAGALDAAAFESALYRRGLTLGADGDFHVLLATDYLDAEVAAANALRLADGHPWLLVRPAGKQLWAGPLLVPGQTACAGCLRIRLMENRWLDGPLLKSGLTLPSPYQAASAGNAAVALELAALEITRWAATGTSALTGRIWSWDVESLGVQWHDVRKLPHCPKCGGRARAEEADDGIPLLDRIAAEQTGIETGILSEPQDFTPGPSWPVLIFGVTYVAPLGSGRPGEATRPQWAIGRGTSADSAIRRAVAEAIERRSLHWHGTEECETASFHDLRERALDPAGLLLFSPTQYDARDQRNGGLPEQFRIPSQFDERESIEWRPVRNLENGIRLAPAALCYLGYPREPEWAGLPDSTGCAAGATWEEAALAGFYELVEREAAAMWWYHRVARPVVRRSFLRRPEFAAVFEYVRDHDVELWVLDLTTDWNVPVCAAALHKDGQVFFAFGCADDPQRAAWQAVSEVFQVLLARTQTHGGVGFTLGWEWRLGREVDPGWGCVDAAPGARLECHCRRAKHLGLELFFLDLTRPDTGLPVVRAIAPGVRPFAPRFAPGRLFEVPVRLGWCEPLGEERMNPDSPPL